MNHMSPTVRSRAVLLLALAMLLVPAGLYHPGDAAECTPVCDSCHYAHDHIYHAYADIYEFSVPASLDGAERKQVRVMIQLYGSVGLGYTTISRGWLELTAAEDRVAIDNPRQDYVSFPPGSRNFYWNVSGRLAGTDTLHVEFYGLGVHLGVEFFERGDSGPITVTNPVNAAPRISFTQPDGDSDTADASFTIGLRTVDPNADHPLVDLYYDTDRDRANGQTAIAKGLLEPTTFAWDTRSLADGWYWLHADVDDQRGGRASATSKFPVIVTHGNRAPYVELYTPYKGAIVADPMVWLRWNATDLDGNSLSYEVYVGRDADHMDLVATTTVRQYHYRPPDNAKLVWTVIPRDGKVRGWCRSGIWGFTTDISYPVSVRLLLPANGSTVAGPSAKLVWYGHDEDYQQVLYDVYLDETGASTMVLSGYDDPAGPVYITADLVPGRTYYWRVVGRNPFSPVDTSATWHFTVADPSRPGAVLLGEELLDGGAARLTWGPRTGPAMPSRYDVHLVSPEGGDTIVLANTTLTEATVEGLAEGMTYRWFALPRALDGSEGVCEPQYREFTVKANTPPVATAVAPLVEADPGGHTIAWLARDDDGDALRYDLYLDTVNATTMVQGSMTETQLSVELAAGRTYRWRVVPFDGHGAGAPASGVIVVRPAGSGVVPTGSLALPAGDVPGPIVVLAWLASDPLGRELSFEVTLLGPSSAPDGEVFTGVSSLNLTVGPLAVGGPYEWTVTATAEGGATSTLGTGSFNVTGAGSLPTPELSVDGAPAVSPVQVVCFTPVRFHAQLPGHSRGGPVVEWWFDFGDGNVTGWTLLDTAEHSYMAPGRYNVTAVARVDQARLSPPAGLGVDAADGDRTSDERLPGMGAGSAVPAILLAAAALAAAAGRRRARRGVV